MKNEKVRIAFMVVNWKKDGRAFSNVKNNDSNFFKAIKLKPISVGITSQTGSDILYYDTKKYNSDNAAIKKIINKKTKK